ncbi:MAG: alpha/beta hydrolase-fold protein [Bacteroidota bacterium]
MCKFKPFFFCCTIFLGYLSFAQAQSGGNDIVIGKSYSLHSEILDEDRPYNIFLPAGYSESGTPVAVMYLMDGDFHFHHTSGIVSFLINEQKMPNMIIVGIPNTPGNRARDLTPPYEKDMAAKAENPNAGQADKMLEFMTKELIPQINKRYNTNDYKTLVGHSFGGIFAAYAFLEYHDTFDSFISISPSMWWDDQNLVDKASAFFDANNDLDNYFYMTMANERGLMRGGAMKLEAIFEEKSPDNFNWTFDIMEDEDHGSLVHRSTYDGLEAIFESWYAVDMREVFAKDGVAGINAHYKMISKKLGHDTAPSEGEWNQLGYAFMGNGDIDRAIEIFEENVRLFPKSHNVYDSLGEAFMAKGDNENAIKNYKESATIHPGNSNAINMLERMGVTFNPLETEYKLSEKKMTAYAGIYDVEDGGQLKIEMIDGNLVASGQGIPPLILTPVYDNAFVAQPLNFLMLFEENKAGEVVGFEGQTGPAQYVNAKKQAKPVKGSRS